MACAAAAIVTGFLAVGLRVVPRRIRVLTVDGYQLVQEGLAAMINREDDMTVVAMASNGGEALNDVRRHRPDVVTLDLLLPDMPGEDLARQILTEFPKMRIVAITSAQGHTHARRALDAGVHGYLSKAVPVCEMVHAIRKVQAGERVVPGPVATRVGNSVVSKNTPNGGDNMFQQRELRLNAAERLGILWCRLKHAAPMWPIHGRYTCRICGRSYRVPWAGTHRRERRVIQQNLWTSDQQP